MHPWRSLSPQPAGGRWRGKLLAAVAALLVGACSTVPAPPPAFDLAAAEFTAGTASIQIVIDGPSSKSAAAGRSAAWGAAIGLFVGLAADVGCSYVCGVAPFVGALLGAASGAAVGAVTSDSAVDIEARRTFLAAEIAQRSASQRLTELLRAQANSESGSPRPWQVTAAVVEAGSAGGGRDQPFAVRLRGQLAIARAGETTPPIILDFTATSTAALTAAGWRAEAAAPLHAAFDECLRSLAAQMLSALRAPGSARAPRPG
jgi:hypothetical protein